VIRHSLNLESGLNDGLALPAVLAFAGALDASKHDFVWWKFVLQDVSIGLATGLVVGYAASRLMPRSRALRSEITADQKALYALGVAFVAYGIAVLPPHGNGLIATFVGAIVLGIRRPDIRAAFEQRSADLIEVVKLVVFVVFGTLLTVHGLFGDGLAAVALVAFLLLVARPVAVFAALARTSTDTAERAFMSWFGPKGVATMTFALLVLAESGIAERERIFNIAALAVLVSIVAHGVTDVAGANWIAARAERRREAARAG
jgi:NhaP-type Na+/H+ or K+/H+ antiporter